MKYDYQVTPRTFSSSMLHEDFEINNYHKPIQINEEWLFKFGFEEVATNEDGGSHFYYHKESDLALDLNYQPFEDWKTNYQLKYIHQLQNLYFARTGEDLQINKIV